jgi:hypothetical protein
MPYQFSIIVIMVMVNAGRTPAEKLTLGFKLLMNLQPRLKADTLIIFKRGFLPGYITYFFSGRFVVPVWIKFLHAFPALSAESYTTL